MSGGADYHPMDDPLSDLSTQGLSNEEIDRIMRGEMQKRERAITSENQGAWKGVFAKDARPPIDVASHGRNFGMVLSTNKFQTRTPGHWVALFGDMDNMSLEYYDSFGERPPPWIMEYIRKVGARSNSDSMFKFKWNAIKDQHEKSVNCGYFAVKFLLRRMRGEPFREASGFESRVRQGEKSIENFKKKIKFEEYF